MEFRFQPNEDKDHSKYLSPSTSNSNYFTEQALRAGYFNNGMIRTDLVGNQDPVREAVQREIEKDRIREEIIAAEIIRRRILEAEVRRELALERELGIPLVPNSLHYQHNNNGNNPVDSSRLQGFPFSSRSEIGNFNSLPFQRHPEAAKIFEAKPVNPNIAGIKRKLTAIGGANELALGGSKKKPQKEWSCALCKVSATSEQGLNAHLQGKKHKAKEVELIRENGAASVDIDSPNTLPKKSDKPELSKTSSSSKPNHGKKSVQAKKKNEEAAMQKKEATSEQGLNDNLQGKNHEAEVDPTANGTPNKDINSSITLPEKIDKPEASKISSNLKPCRGKKTVKVMKKKNGEATLQAKLPTEDLKKKFKFWCEDCQIGCQSATVMSDHKNGKKHKALLLAPKQDDGSVKQLVLKKVEAAVQKTQKTEDFKKKFKFWCEKCQVGCHSAITMANHERGKKHMYQLQALNEDGGDVLVTTTTTTKSSEADKAEVVKEASDEVMENTDGEVDGGEEPKERGEEAIAQLLAPKKDGVDVLATATNSTETTGENAEAVEEASEEIMENFDGEVDGGQEPQERSKEDMVQLPASEEDGGDVLATTNTTATKSTEATVENAVAVDEASEEIMENFDGEVDGGKEPHEDALEMKVTAGEVAKAEERRI